MSDTPRTDAEFHKDGGDDSPAVAFARQLERELSAALAQLSVAKCPNCDGSGGIPRQTSSRQVITREMALDAGCPEMDGSLYSDDEWEIEQCQWCDERAGLLGKNCKTPSTPEAK